MLPPKLPSDISQQRLLKALKKSGFIINYTGGKGSHAKAVDPKTKKFITVQSNLYKVALKEILKYAEELGYDAEKILDEY